MKKHDNQFVRPFRSGDPHTISHYHPDHGMYNHGNDITKGY